MRLHFTPQASRVFVNSFLRYHPPPFSKIDCPPSARCRVPPKVVAQQAKSCAVMPLPGCSSRRNIVCCWHLLVWRKTGDIAHSSHGGGGGYLPHPVAYTSTFFNPLRGKITMLWFTCVARDARYMLVIDGSGHQADMGERQVWQFWLNDVHQRRQARDRRGVPYHRQFTLLHIVELPDTACCQLVMGELWMLLRVSKCV